MVICLLVIVRYARDAYQEVGSERERKKEEEGIER